MAGNVYGLRLLRKPAVRDTGLLLIAGVLVVTRLIGLFFVPGVRRAYDFIWYWLAAGNLLSGHSIYSATQLAGPYAPQGQEGFLYPPPLAALVIPLRLASPADPLPAWIVWSSIAAVIAFVSIVALARDEHLGERFAWLAGWRIGLVLVAAFALPEVIDELVNGNVHLYLLGLFTVAWLGIRRGDVTGQRIAGISIGVAAVIKVFPGIALLWFLLTGRRIAAVWTIVGAAALSLATLPVTGVQPWLDFPTVLANMSAPVDPSASFAPTLWLSPVVGFTIARILVTASGLVIVAWSAVRQEARRSFAVVALVSVLITPALWSHYLSLIVFPFVIALGSGASLPLLGLDYLLLSSGNQGALGDLAWITIRLLPTIGELLLLVVLLRRRAAPDAAPSARSLAPA